MDLYLLVAGLLAVVLMVGVPFGCVLVLNLVNGGWADYRLRWHDRSLFQRRRPLDRSGPPLEQVAADLRRLRGQLRIDETRSALHQIGGRLAYDQILGQACGMLEIHHSLDAEIGGYERDLERVRVELALEGAGLVLSDKRRGEGQIRDQAA